MDFRRRALPFASNLMGEYVKHHVKEEHAEMFPKVKKTKLDLKELGAKMAARKEELMAQDHPAPRRMAAE